ncbi:MULTISPECIES: iron-containing alcohol dehydrogenase family protein [unclassified Enterococcus]|uniref:iron-containing alcohol dehydrogenase family protein n=1 Tax=unclassified Enterococcus TaxID=2608891 RepID=UPI001557F068|nr:MULTISPECIES: iron-containing alcohol dehydrogenase family protein [unclassified Enterococcus]MBS7576576.1 iron-containing alcohol dehydrogenase family protein [Enterococcus sp. MMGLQ5-2]MBS7583937.1 iron-containing alcohol dehydrogenase family protein [Enterococcus sp. MMGLQ5-1]NPD11798.1 iron-containing alcohol dehydrogenase family protein [Enterococcus sp. MMGLQ5-1]NPD36413.1 iron-containing alcohol dehydrogenase family protein [Enterococcus sp. MMGLQ5-2]
MKIRTPNEYIVRESILSDLGNYVKKYGDRIVIISSSNGFTRFQAQFEASLDKNEISWKKFIFSGFPTFDNAQSLSTFAKTNQIQAIIALGGGQIIDTAKIAGSYAEIPVIAVPTIAATCASWAAVSIVYDDRGIYQTAYFNQSCPVYVLVDLRVIFSASKRYLFSGVIDTFAKWYEISPYLKHANPADASLKTVVSIAKEAFSILKRQTDLALSEAADGIYNENAQAVIDAIIFQAGLTGSLESGKLYQGIAHPFYDASTQIINSNRYLHGEKVGFGLLIQKYLERADEVEWQETLALFKHFNNVLTLQDLGITDQEVQLIAKHIWENRREQLLALNLAASQEEIAEGIIQANQRIEKWLVQNG